MESVRLLQSEIHSNYSAVSGDWAAYNTKIFDLFSATGYNASGSATFQDFSDHLVREYNTKIAKLGMPTGLFFAPYDAGYRLVSNTLTPLTTPFSPLSLFSAGEQGVWYDPSDLTTMFEDSAGTTTVHTPGNGTADSPVGKILDKSGRGNHATQSTSTARPALSAKYNLLTYTEQFDNAFWNKNVTSITADSTNSPIGTLTADSLFETASNNYHGIAPASSVVSTASGQSYIFSVYVKANGRTKGYLSIVAGGGYCLFDLTAVTNTFGGNGTSETVTAQTIASAGDGWYLVTITSSFSGVRNCQPTISLLDASGNASYVGDVTKGFYIWGADLRVSNDGVGLPVYQRVVDANTYNSVGFPYYLKFDGVDDHLKCASYLMGLIQRTSFVAYCQSPSLNSNYVGIASVYAGGDDYNTVNAYTLNVNQPVSAQFVIQGSTLTSYQLLYNVGAQVSQRAVFTENKSAGLGVLRKNGIQYTTDTAFTEFSASSSGGLIVGARWLAAPGYYLAGRIYSLILRGTSSTATETSNTENWINQKILAY